MKQYHSEFVTYQAGNRHILTGALNQSQYILYLLVNHMAAIFPQDMLPPSHLLKFPRLQESEIITCGRYHIIFPVFHLQILPIVLRNQQRYIIFFSQPFGLQLCTLSLSSICKAISETGQTVRWTTALKLSAVVTQNFFKKVVR